MAMWKRGRRLFSTAAILLLLMAMAHALGNLSYQPSNAAEEKLMADMAAFHAPLGLGMSPSVKDIYFCLGWAVSLLIATLGVMNLLLAAIQETPASVLRRVSIWNAIWVGVFGALCWRYHVPPPLISCVVIEAVVLTGILSQSQGYLKN